MLDKCKLCIGSNHTSWAGSILGLSRAWHMGHSLYCNYAIKLTSTFLPGWWFFFFFFFFVWLLLSLFESKLGVGLPHIPGGQAVTSAETRFHFRHTSTTLNVLFICFSSFLLPVVGLVCQLKKTPYTSSQISKRRFKALFFCQMGFFSLRLLMFSSQTNGFLNLFYK